MEEAGEEDDFAVCACREEAAAAGRVATELVMGIFASTAWGCSARASAPAATRRRRRCGQGGEPSATVDALLQWCSGVSSSILSAGREETGRGGVERMGDDDGATRATPERDSSEMKHQVAASGY